MTDRTTFDIAPIKVGWYGTESMGNENEFWVGPNYWDGASWSENSSRAIARSTTAFDTEAAAWEWCNRQPD